MTIAAFKKTNDLIDGCSRVGANLFMDRFVAGFTVGAVK